jgi:hypothetical protein
MYIFRFNFVLLKSDTLMSFFLCQLMYVYLSVSINKAFFWNVLRSIFQSHLVICTSNYCRPKHGHWVAGQTGSLAFAPRSRRFWRHCQVSPASGPDASCCREFPGFEGSGQGCRAEGQTPRSFWGPWGCEQSSERLNIDGLDTMACQSKAPSTFQIHCSNPFDMAGQFLLELECSFGVELDNGSFLSRKRRAKRPFRGLRMQTSPTLIASNDEVY